MNNPIDPELIRQLNEDHQDLRLKLGRLPHRNAPTALMSKLRHEYVRRSWIEQVRTWFSPSMIWRPVGALTLAALMVGMWISKVKRSEAEFIDMQPLVTAHSRYQEETLVPAGDMAGSNYGGQLAMYYEDHK